MSDLRKVRHRAARYMHLPWRVPSRGEPAENAEVDCQADAGESGEKSMIRLDEPVHRMELGCDKLHCFQGIRVTMDTREECNLELYRAGWRLYRGKQFCPEHSEQITERRGA